MRLLCLLLLISVTSATHFAGLSFDMNQKNAGEVDIYLTSTWSCNVPNMNLIARTARAFTSTAGESSCHSVGELEVDLDYADDSPIASVNDNGIEQELIAFGITWAQLARTITETGFSDAPIKFSLSSQARISTLKDNNENTPYSFEGQLDPASGIDRTPWFFNPGKIFVEKDAEFRMPIPAYQNYELYIGVVEDRAGLVTSHPTGMRVEDGDIVWTPSETGIYVVQFSFVSVDFITVGSSWEVQFEVKSQLIPSPTVTFDPATNIITATKECESGGKTVCHIFHSANPGIVTPIDGFCLQDNSSCTRRFQFTPPVGVDNFRGIPCFYAFSGPDMGMDLTLADLPPGFEQWSPLECISLEVGTPIDPFVDPPNGVDGFLVIKDCMGCETDCGEPHRGVCNQDLCACECRHPFTSTGSDKDDCTELEDDC